VVTVEPAVVRRNDQRPQSLAEGVLVSSDRLDTEGYALLGNRRSPTSSHDDRILGRNATKSPLPSMALPVTSGN
jgi:hypothetical protein